MSIRRDWFLGVALAVGLLLCGVAYFLWAAHQLGYLATNNSTSRIPVSNTLSAPTAPPPPPSQFTSESAPAYQYNAQGQLQMITYPNGSVYAYRYDAYGNKISETSPTGKTWSYVYDQNHHPVSVIGPTDHVVRQESSSASPSSDGRSQ
jgi:YD repeat-containing protein